MEYAYLLRRCEVCPRRCGVNRLEGKVGFCRVDQRILISHYGRHFGEEPPISGESGSGNIFFTSCNMRCIYCQNYQISQEMLGTEVSLDRLIEIFFELREQGAHNINLVSPTPYIPHLIEALKKARDRGLDIPVVYNTNSYERKEILRYMRGLVDIYLPDMRYSNDLIAERLSSSKSYTHFAKEAILEMRDQVGEKLIMEDGIGKRGMIVRLLVLPNNLSGTKKALEWIFKNLGKDTTLSIMAQYEPLFRASEVPMLSRRIKEEEYNDVVEYALSLGFEDIFIQELESSKLFIPDFTKEEPFSV